MIYRIFNAGEISQLAHGDRSVVALEPGRKWIVVVDWTTLETAKIRLDVWQRMKPVQVDYRKRPVLKAMKERLQYVTATEAIKDAMKLVREMAA